MLYPPMAVISRLPAAATGMAATAAIASDHSYQAADQPRRAAAPSPAAPSPAGPVPAGPDPGSAARCDQTVQLARSTDASKRGRTPTTSMRGSPMTDQASSTAAATG